MPIFGNNNPTSIASPITNPTNIFIAKFTLTEDGDVSKITAYSWDNPPGLFAKGLIYADVAGTPGILLGVTQGAAIANLTTWNEFVFSSPISLSAGDYWLGIVGNAATVYGRADVFTAGSMKLRNDGADWYNNPPNPFGTPTAAPAWLACIYATYELGGNPYPTNMLKKGFISAYHCFMSAYIRAKVTGYDPLKLPDGTVF